MRVQKLELRGKSFLFDLSCYFNQTSPLAYAHIFQIIIVDDGSTDKTAILAVKYYSADPQHVRLISLSKNQGKGGAVKVGVKNSFGDYILMADADGATDIKDLEKLFIEMERIEIESQYHINDKVQPGIVVGSR